MTGQLPNCPKCGSIYAYESHGLFICPECGHEWPPTERVAGEGLVVKDPNGNLLVGGDSVTVIRDLKVRGANGTIKRGTKVENVRLIEGDHNIDCKIDGFGPMKLKSKSVREN